MMTSTVYKTVSSQSLPAIPCENDGNMLMRESDTYEVLRKKKQALEEKLKLKLQQLKSLCLKEADIIGELPPETPLDPNEPVPQIRKRVGAEFILNQNLLSKARSFEEENLAKLELEMELQRKIVKANLKLTNEVNLKKNVKKKRLQSYQDAVLRLKELEKKLLEMKKKMEDGSQYDNQKARSEINYSSSNANTIAIRPKSSLALVSDINQAIEDEEDDQAAEPGDSYLSTSAPSSPGKFRDPERHIRPISPPTIVTSSIPNRYDIRPSSVHFPFAKGNCEVDSHQPERCKTAEHFSHDYDSCSIGSASSCESSIFRIANDTKRRNILSLLQTHNSNESLDTVTSHLYSLPKRNSTVESIGSTPRLSNFGEAKLSNIPTNSNTNDFNPLTRHDSLENTRRKSYVSAIQTPHIPGALHHHQPSQHHYHCLSNSVLTEDCEEFARPEIISKCHRSSQPLCLPPPSINMASRPLPPPPSPSCSSSSSRDSPSIHNPDTCSYNNVKLDESKLYQNICDFGKAGSIHDDHLDISSKAVRSSIIRTPIAITISTSSTDASQLVNHRQPTTPAPSLPPRTPSSIPNSASTIHNDENIFFATKATTFNPDNLESSHSTMPPPKVWSETDLDSHPGKIDRKQDPKHDSSYNIYYNDLPEIDVSNMGSHDYENIEPAEPIDSHLRSSKSSCSTSSSSKVSPRPPSIPLSPTIPPATNGVEVNVVSVGHFQPYWEETKPYELSDFFKYSAKHRKALTESGNSRSSVISNASSTSSSIPSQNQPQSQQHQYQHQQQSVSSSIPVTSSKSTSNKLINSNNSKMKVVTSASHSSSYRDPHLTNRPNGPMSNPKLGSKDSALKKDPYKDDANWYENDIIKNPTIV